MRTLAFISYQPFQGWGPISPHGIGTALGFALGAALFVRSAESRGISKQVAGDAVTWGLIGAIIGARGFYVLAHLDNFNSLGEVFALWQGGLTMFGGFIGGLALGVGFAYRRRVNIPKALDATAAGFVAGVIVGRIGDLIIADHLGEPTKFALGYLIPNGADLAPGFGPPTYFPGAVVHQTALYDLAGALVLAGVLALVARKRPATGSLFALFATWYGLQRFAIDFTRNRELIESSFNGLSGSQWTGLLFAAGGLLGFIQIARNRRKPVPEPTIQMPLPDEQIPWSEPILPDQSSDEG